MKPSILTLATLVLITSVSGLHAADAAVDSADKSFLKDAYEDGLAEVKLAELAGSKTGNAEVKTFAQHMVTDHTKANAELKTLADNKKVEVPAEPSTTAKGKAKLLDGKTGADFDKAYVKQAVSDHEKAVKAFAKAAAQAKDADVKAFAVKTLPTLEGHLKMVQELQSKIGK